MAPKIKIPVRRTGRALAHLHSKPSPHTRLVPHFAGTLRSPQIKMRFAHGWRQPELHFGEARTRFPASHEPPGGASREPCAHLRSKCASRMGGGSEFEKPVSIAKNNTTTMSWCYFFGAGDEARTRYLHLGKVALYQMSYARGTLTIIADSFAFVKPYFSFFRRFWFCRLANAEKL